MFLAVVNKSTQLTKGDTQKAVDACASQVKLHVAPIWDMLPAPIVFYASEGDVPAGADLLVILDDSDQAGMLGYHRETPQGTPYSRVFVRPVLKNGGKVTTGSGSVSATVSHEVCEWLADRFLNLWAEGPKGQTPIEICDPVERDSYEIHGVSVSNFVTKRFFDQNAPAGTQFDYMKSLTEPFTCTPGGLMQVRKLGKVRTVYGKEYPAWRKASKRFPAARTARRLSV